MEIDALTKPNKLPITISIYLSHIIVVTKKGATKWIVCMMVQKIDLESSPLDDELDSLV